MPAHHPRILPFTAASLRSIEVLAIPVKRGDSDNPAKIILEGGAQIRPLLKNVKDPDAADRAGSVSVDLNALVIKHKLSGKAGELLEVPVKANKLRAIFLVGVGDGTRADLVKAGSAIGRKLRSSATKCASLCGGKGELTRAHALALALSAYQFKVSTTNAVNDAPTFTLIRNYDYEQAQAMLEGTLLTRDLIHTPSNMKSPQSMAAQAKKSLAKFPVTITVHQGEKALSRFGG